MESFVTGIIMGFSLIVAIGAQNIWVLSQSMNSEHRLSIALTCIACDVSLITIGVFFAVRLQTFMPELIPWLVWGGVGLLIWLSGQAFIRAYRGSSNLIVGSCRQLSLTRTVATTLGISLLNPHVYLDTVILLGNIGGMQALPNLFAIGAAFASIVWFSSLTYFAPKLKLWLNSTFRWRIFDSLIGSCLLIIAINLLKVV